MNTQAFAILAGIILIVFVVFSLEMPKSSISGFDDSEARSGVSTSDPSSTETGKSRGMDKLFQPANPGTQATGEYPRPDSSEATTLPGRIVVSGQVSDENYEPIENVMVSDETNFGHVRTDATGRFQIEIEMPLFKSPFLNFLRSGYQENRFGVPLDQLSAEATVVLDVQLREAENSTTVPGWVGNDLGQGLAGHTVRLRARSSQNSGIFFYAVISDEQGKFTFEGIRSGLEYRLDIKPTREYAGYSLEPYRVSQNPGRLVIVLDTLELVEINGMIVGTDSVPIADFNINIQNLSVDTPDRRITSDSSGFFKLDAFPAGEVKLSTNVPEYYKITGLTIRENNYRHLILTVDRGGYHLSGWVSDTNDMPLAEARVTLHAVSEANEYLSHSYRSTLTDAYGGFQFQRVGGWDHSLSVFSAGYQTRVIKHAFTNYVDSVNIRLARDDD